MKIETCPEGYRTNADGHLVPEAIIKPIDKARDDLVRELAFAALESRQNLRNFKTRAFADLRSFVELSAEHYGVKLGGTKGNVTLHSFDGSIKVQISVAQHLTFDERLQAAKALIDECITDWAQNSRDEIKVLISEAFQMEKEGKINTGRVLALRRLDIKDTRWQNAMTAISESLQVVGSKEYVRFYERVAGTDQYQPISLDIAGV